MNRTKRQVKKPGFIYDRWLLGCVLVLLAFGLLMVASASMVVSDKQFGFPFHYVIRQAIYLMLGVGVLWFVTRLPAQLWQKWSSLLLLVSLFLLMVVLVPHIGRVVNGSRRWINLGFITLQVSEVAKFCAILYMASYLERFQNQVRTQFVGFLKPMIVLALISGLLLMEPDFGAASVIAVTFLLLLFIAGVRLWPLSLLFALVAVIMVGLVFVSPYRLARLTTFLHPWHLAYGSGYQLTQSLIAFGRGGLFGVGLGNSVQKLFYLPEAHTDFLFAVIGEELGLIGELLVVALFTTLIVRIMRLGRFALQQNQCFYAYLSFGLGLWLGLQAMINMGVNIGLLPTKGLTLPFISYGGSSMLINCLAIGILLRISYELSFFEGNQSVRRHSVGSRMI